MNDLSFVDRLPDRIDEIRSRREHYADIVHEGLRQKLKHLHDDAEQAIDYARDAIRAGRSVSEELKEMQALALSLQLVVEMLSREAKGE